MLALLADLLCVGAPHASGAEVIGRHSINSAGAAIFDHPGVRIVATISHTPFVNATFFQAASAQIPNHFRVTVDGEPQDVPTFDTRAWPKGDDERVSVPIALPGNASASSHEIIIEKTSEALFSTFKGLAPNYVGFVGFTGADSMVVSHPPPAKRRVEFLGDSITAGYCNLCDDSGSDAASSDVVRNPFMGGGGSEDVRGGVDMKALVGSVDQESFALSWANLACDALEAECHVAAWSGLGMAKNCCGGETLMSDVWRRTVATIVSDDPEDPHGTTAQNE